MAIYGTLRIEFDATDSDCNDADHDISELVLEALRTKFDVYDIVEHTADTMIVSVKPL